MRRTVALFVPLCILCLCGVVRAEIALVEDQPTVGQETTVTITGRRGGAIIPLGNVDVRATYYPNSEVQKDAPIGRTDAKGQVAWTPEYPGIVNIIAEVEQANPETRTVSVRYDGLPVSGLIVFLIAGCLLTAGAIFAARKLMVAQGPPPAEQ